MFGVRSRGLLDVAGEMWREYGDVFPIRIGQRSHSRKSEGDRDHDDVRQLALELAMLAQRFTRSLRQGYQARWEMQGVLSLANSADG